MLFCDVGELRLCCETYCTSSEPQPFMKKVTNAFKKSVTDILLCDTLNSILVAEKLRIIQSLEMRYREKRI